MELNPDIILGYKAPVVSTADQRDQNAQALQAGDYANQESQIKIRNANSAQQNEMTRRQIAQSSNGDMGAYVTGLKNAGMMDEASKAQKYLDENTASADTHTTSNMTNMTAKSKAIGSIAGSVASLPLDQIHSGAGKAIDYLQQNGLYDENTANEARQHIGTMQPQELQGMMRQMQNQALTPEQQMPKNSVQNLGGTAQPISQDIYGAVTPVGQPMQVTQTPDQIANTKYKDDTLAETKRSNFAKESSKDDTDITLSSDAINNASARYNIDGTLPNLGVGKKSALQKANILNQAALMNAGIDPTDQRIYQIDNKSKAGALLQNTKDIAAITPYKEMLDKNVDIAIKLSKNVMMTNSKFANKSLNWIKQNAGDNPDAAEYLAQMVFVQTESARVLNNPRLVGQLTDSARQEMEGVINGNMPIQATERVLQRIKQDGDNRVNSMLDQHDNLIRGFKNPGLTNRATNSKYSETRKLDDGSILGKNSITGAIERIK